MAGVVKKEGSILDLENAEANFFQQQGPEILQSPWLLTNSLIASEQLHAHQCQGSL